MYCWSLARHAAAYIFEGIGSIDAITQALQTTRRGYPRAEMPMLVDLYMAGKLKLDELVSRTFSLEEINTAFDVLDRGEVARSIIRYT